MSIYSLISGVYIFILNFNHTTKIIKVGEPKSAIYTPALPSLLITHPPQHFCTKTKYFKNVFPKMGSTSKHLGASTMASSDEEASLFAMQLASASVLPMVLKSAIELDLLQLIKKAGPGAFVSPVDLAAQLPTTNAEAPVMLDRILRLLASYSVLECSLRELPGGGVERLYGLAPVCKYLTKNEDSVSMAPLLLMNQDKILMESW